MIIDGRFVDPHAAFGQFDGQFRLQSEAIAANGDALQQRSAEGFVAGLHVGQIQVRNDIAHQGQNVVGHGVPEVEHPAFAGDHEARAIDGVSFPLQQRRQQASVFARIVFQIGILNDGELAGGVLDGGTDGGALTLIAGLPDESQYGGVGRGDLFHDCGRAVRGAVVHHDNLPPDSLR